MNYPMIPVRGMTIFPGTTVHFDIGRAKSIEALDKAMDNDKCIFLVSQKNDNIDLPTVDDFYYIGVLAKVKQMLKLPGDTVRVLVEALYTATITEITSMTPYIECQILEVENIETENKLPEEEALMRTGIEMFAEYEKTANTFNPEHIEKLINKERAGDVANYIASKLDLSVEENQEILEEMVGMVKLTKVLKALQREIEIIKLEDKISSQVKKRMDEQQKDYYLREKIRAIQGELGMTSDANEDMMIWHDKLKALNLEPKIAKKIEKEIKKYSYMQSNMADAAVVRTYIETLLDLPWHELSKDEIDVKKANKILENEHYGLDKVKERIIEQLAVMKLSNNIKTPILCLVGPPGTGKTSIAKSIAHATGREFVRMSLGGLRDEAEIRGHRRTYIGAVPGRIITNIKECGTRNPVFLLDEIDKMSIDVKGDPSAALLEVLDPEQNSTFQDNYLEVPFDLSKVLFVTTANDLSTIQAPLRDRMEIIEVTGYTEEEKLQIAKKYLIPKKIKEFGIDKKQFSMTDKAIRDLINYYTRESGVRNLERIIATLIRKIAKKIVFSECEEFKIKPSDLEDLLGKKAYHYDKINANDEVGVVTGMAWTQVGGDILFIEVSVVEGTGKIQLTGNLGDVMQESAKTAISFVRSKASKYGIDDKFYENKDIHIHVPEGAVPKDGPSAGVTMSTAIVSALTGRNVRKDVAMTGEVTLRGNVLAIGGVKEKVLAAYRAGIRKILLPYDNEKDIDEIPENVRKKLEFVLVKNVDDALEEALVK